MDADLIEKYRKVQALVGGGTTEGERRAAASVLLKMEQRYPGIGAAASQTPPPQPSGAFGFPPGESSGFRPSGRAESPKDGGFMGGVFDFLRNAAAGLREGLTLRDRVLDVVAVETRTNSRTARITVTIPLDGLVALYEDFGEDHAVDIAVIVGALVRDEFVEALSMGLDDPP
jgi:hypothetical protein